MAYTVEQLRGSLRIYPKDCLVNARIPDGPGHRLERLTRVHHHNQDPGTVHEDQPVEIFADKDEPLTVGELDQALSPFPGTSLVRVAVRMPKESEDDPGHHRILDIDTTGAGIAEQGQDLPPVEMHTERWDSLSYNIRRDDHVVGADHGDVSYFRDAEVDEHGNRTESGGVKMMIAGRAPAQSQGEQEPGPAPRGRR